MNIRRNIDRRLWLTAVVLGSFGPAVYGQAPAVANPMSSKILMQELLGGTTNPTMSLFVIDVDAGATIPLHTDRGSVFAYILQGDIEKQREPEPPRIFHSGDIFSDHPMQVDRVLRNLSKTAPSKILILQNTGALPPALKPLLQEQLSDLSDQVITVIKGVVSPGALVPGVHQHPGPVFAYILRGEIESQVDPGPPKAYHEGDVFYEPPLHAHRLFRNLSATEPAELLVFEVTPKGKPLAMGVGK